MTQRLGSILIILTVLLLGAACTRERASLKAAELKEEPVNTFSFIGSVTYVPLEGGFFGIVTDDGDRLDPVNLPASVKQDGLRIRGQARNIAASIGFHMWGTRVEIEWAEPLPH
ncbi:hypothetical protein [Desulfuromonas sp. AOP6]|uniref:hypothetical protein n=1 Tax=Desulfuromonas sp. AOP6 TaxID=1566351 RepID=UPI00128615B5|nr:hypothetical protein [Desulfuromonas sp. AOP6]BCA79313.1 hypothetical protein AOP6_1100 [Desulfuromonas sp. AOP6]